MQTTDSTALRSDVTDEPPDQPIRVPDAGRSCLCGARLTGRQVQCRKCRSRERWHRRNQHDADSRRRTDAYRTTALLLGGAR